MLRRLRQWLDLWRRKPPAGASPPLAVAVDGIRRLLGLHADTTNDEVIRRVGIELELLQRERADLLGMVTLRSAQPAELLPDPSPELAALRAELDAVYRSNKDLRQLLQTRLSSPQPQRRNR
jgi:hypothetical protein